MWSAGGESPSGRRCWRTAWERGERDTFTSAFTSVLIACRPLRKTSTSPRSLTSAGESRRESTHLLVDLAEDGEVGRGVQLGVERERRVAFGAGTAVGPALLVDGAVEDWEGGEGEGFGAPKTPSEGGLPTGGGGEE